MKKERVLITVKTYPTLSSTYGELVCTAGIRESTGEWLRIYPMPFRRLKERYHYKKYQWVNIELLKNQKDSRVESYRPVNIHDLELLECIDSTKSGWNMRKRFVLNPQHLFTSQTALMEETRAGKRSLAVFKPREYLGFSVVETDKAYEKKKQEACESMLAQTGLFDKDYMREIKLAEKIPYRFKINFRDDDGKTPNLMIEDWEICQLYRNCIRSSDSEKAAIEKVCNKCEQLMRDTDLYLILGTTKEWHSRSLNPYIIIGLFYPPVDNQLSLGF